MVANERNIVYLQSLEAILSNVADGVVTSEAIIEKTGIEPRRLKKLVERLLLSKLLESINGEQFMLTIKGWEFLVYYKYVKKALNSLRC